MVLFSFYFLLIIAFELIIAGNVASTIADYSTILLNIYLIINNIARGENKTKNIVKMFSFLLPYLIIQIQNNLKPGSIVSVV